MPRFVVLEHDHPALHWDFMLEAGPVLRTWRLSAPPARDRIVEAAASFDHRPAYLDYEGPVSGGRGRVRRWDGGDYELTDDTSDGIVVRLIGARLQGQWRLDRLAGGAWRLSPLAEGGEERGGGGG